MYVKLVLFDEHVCPIVQVPFPHLDCYIYLAFHIYMVYYAYVSIV